MKQTILAYPKYSPGEVLTHSSLNSSFGYLEEQDRLVRSSVIGSGIVDGLEYRYTNGKITICKGVALTADGFYIQVTKDTTFKYACSVNANSAGDNAVFSEKLPLSDEPSSDEFNMFLKNSNYVFFESIEDVYRHKREKGESIAGYKDYYLALVIDFSASEYTLCSETSCDLLRNNYSLCVHPVLFRYTKGERQFVYKLKPIDKKVVIKGSQCVLSSSNAALITKKMLQVFENNRKILSNAIEEILRVLNMDLSGCTSTFNNTVNDLKNFYNKRKQIDWKKDGIQYFYLQYENDLCAAINEFYEFYNYFVDKYDVIHTAQLPTERVVVLGRLYKNDDYDESRQLFKPVLVDASFKQDSIVLERLVKRIHLMMANFIGIHEKHDKFKSLGCVIERQASKLGERVIPYYYEEDSSLKDVWMAHKQNSYGTMAYSEYKKSHADYVQFPDDCFSIQGICGQSIATVEKEIKSFFNKAIPPFSFEFKNLNNNSIYDYRCLLEYFERNKYNKNASEFYKKKEVTSPKFFFFLDDSADLIRRDREISDIPEEKLNDFFKKRENNFLVFIKKIGNEYYIEQLNAEKGLFEFKEYLRTEIGNFRYQEEIINTHNIAAYKSAHTILLKELNNYKNIKALSENLIKNINDIANRNGNSFIYIAFKTRVNEFISRKFSSFIEKPSYNVEKVTSFYNAVEAISFDRFARLIKSSGELEDIDEHDAEEFCNNIWRLYDDKTIIVEFFKSVGVQFDKDELKNKYVVALLGVIDYVDNSYRENSQMLNNCPQGSVIKFYTSDDSVMFYSCGMNYYYRNLER